MPDDMEQTSIFDFAYPPFRVTKPLRLIELFAGYGSQLMAWERLQKEGLLPFGVQSYKIVEWAVPSFIAYAAIHHPEDGSDYSEGRTKEEIASALFDKGASLDWNKPAPLRNLLMKGEPYLRRAYNAMVASHDLVDVSKVKGSDLAMRERERVQVMLTYSFPCQDLSLAGKRAGMDEGTGTRSSLLWQVRRILGEMAGMGQAPDFLMMENVPQVVSHDNARNMAEWQGFLSSLGYKSYIKIQSATDFGVPQTRKRCFMFSFLGDWSYRFADPFPLRQTIMDRLEKDVPPKYYLSEKMIRYILSPKGGTFNKSPKLDRKVAATIHSDCSSQRAQFDNYVTAPIVVGNANGHQSGRCVSADGPAPAVEAHTHGATAESVMVIDEYNHSAQKKATIPAIKANYHNNGTAVGIPIKDATIKGYEMAYPGDGVYISNLKNKRGTVQRGKIPTIKAGTDVGVVCAIDKSKAGKVKTVANCITAREDRGVSHREASGTAVIEIGSYTPSGISGKVVDPKGVAPTMTTGNNGNTEGIIEVGNIYPKSGNAQAGSAPTLDVMSGGNRQPKVVVPAPKCLNPKVDGVQPSLEYRVYSSEGPATAVTTAFPPNYLDGISIRKLTPREAFRLQDVLDSDFDRIKGLFGDSVLYHLAGDSICVANLYYDFRQMCPAWAEGKGNR